MLDKVRVLNDRAINKLLVFNKATDGIRIKEVTGLGPVDAEVNTTSRAGGASGVNYNSHHIGARNIVFSLALSRSGTKTVENVRHDAYTYFPVGEEVELRFESSGVISQIFGRVESVTPEIFTKEPSIQVSVLCVEPYFKLYSGVPNSVTLLSENVDVEIAYQGRVKTGITFEIEVIDLPPPTIYGHVELRQDFNDGIFRGFKIYDFDIAGVTGGVVSRFTLGDRIIVSTTQGKKEAVFIRGTDVYNIMGTLKDDQGLFLNTPQWPLLPVGKTTSFRYNSTIYDPAHLQVKVNWDVLLDGL